MNPPLFPIGQLLYLCTVTGLIVFALAAICHAVPKIIKARRSWAELLINRLVERRLELIHVDNSWLVCRNVWTGTGWTQEPLGDGHQWQTAAHNALRNLAKLEGKDPTEWQQTIVPQKKPQARAIARFDTTMNALRAACITPLTADEWRLIFRTLQYFDTAAASGLCGKVAAHLEHAQAQEPEIRTP